MKSKLSILSSVLLCAIGTVASAQLLDTTTISDQFTTGSRGSNTLGTGPGGSGGTLLDGSEGLAYSGSDSATTGAPLYYINSYQGASGAGDANPGEAPVLNVSAATMMQPDRGNLFSALTPPITVPVNTRPGATSGSDVLVISDDGGQNTILVGDTSSADYSASVDFFAIDRSVNPTQYEAANMAIRACRDGATLTGSAYSIDREPSYSLWYDYNLREVRAIRYQAGTSTANLGARAGVGVAYAQQYGPTITSVTNGWHTFKISANGSTIKFYFDGVQIGTDVTDTNVTNGRVAIAYRAGGTVLATAESAGIFDNLVVQPTTSVASSWSLYQ